MDIYMRVLLGLIQTRGFEVFVHAIAPVLNETRPVVRQFVAELRRRCLAVAAAAGGRAAVGEQAVPGGGSEAKGKLHFLDFFEDLLEEGGDALKAGLSLDGTHMSPDYLLHMQAALDRCTA